MKPVWNNLIPFGRFAACNLFGVIFLRKGRTISTLQLQETVNHEQIHTAQMKELGFLPFYLIYGVEWVYRKLTAKGDRKFYRQISFEREAYLNEHDLSYLRTRQHYAQWKQ